MSEEDYKKELWEARRYAIGQFDKYILAISSGALGISFAFLEQIVKFESAIHNCILMVSWIALGGSIVLCLIGHFVSIKQIELTFEDLNESSNVQEKNRKERVIVMDIINIILIIGITLGIGFLIIYVLINL